MSRMTEELQHQIPAASKAATLVLGPPSGLSHSIIVSKTWASLQFEMGNRGNSVGMSHHTR